MIALNDVREMCRAHRESEDERMARRPAGVPRGAWRGENPVTTDNALAVLDLAFKTRPRRSMFVAPTSGRAYSVMIMAAAGRVVERIDLSAQDAQARLDRYEIAR